MKFLTTKLAGAYLIVPDKKEDERGFFARTWCRKDFQTRGLCDDWVQMSVSYNRWRGTLRGLHYQAEPHQEAKLVHCTRGAIYDVIVDLRPESPTYLHWLAARLTREDGNLIYIPENFAHGFQTLTDDCEVSYSISAYYQPSSSRGIRWDDPQLNIAWPDCDERCISPRDLALPTLAESAQFTPLKCG